MHGLVKRLTIAGLVAASSLLLNASSRGQYQPILNPNGHQPPANTQSIVRSVNVNQSPFVSNPGYYPPYFPYYQDPYNGYLSGAADVIGAQGQFMVSKQQSEILKQQAKQAELDTRRKAFAQWQWEQKQKPTLEDVRQQSYMQAQQWARGNPSLAQIWSGQSLNFLLEAIQREQAAEGITGPTIPLDPEIVRRLNVTTGATSTTQGSIAMIQNGKLTWPTVFTESQFDQRRTQIDEQIAASVKQVVGNGRVNGDTLSNLRRSVDALREQLRGQVAEMSADDYMAGVRYINQLRDAINQLAAPNAANYLNGTWQARGNTVSELVSNMAREGLRFAPATAGNESSYTALQSALLAYDTGLARMTRRGGMPQPQLRSAP
jgi:hypothetical protein